MEGMKAIVLAGWLFSAPCRRVVGVATASGPAVSGRRAIAAGSAGVV